MVEILQYFYFVDGPGHPCFINTSSCLFHYSFQAVYQGSAHMFKVNKLSEVTSYDFRLYASNVAGSGPYSETYTFTTTKAPPPALKGRVTFLSNVLLDFKVTLL